MSCTTRCTAAWWSNDRQPGDDRPCQSAACGSIHNLERAADRVTNICERTVFIATGELIEMDTDDLEDLE